MRQEDDVQRAIELYSDMVRRICIVHLKNKCDSEDIFQNVFLKYAMNDIKFDSLEHEKAWIIRVTLNACKDLIKKFYRSHEVCVSTLIEPPLIRNNDTGRVLESVLSLPAKYKDVIYLSYYEQYTSVEIAGLLHKNVNTVYSLLSRAKKQLKEKLGGEYDE